MAYVKRHSTNNIKASISYIRDKEKTEELLIYNNNLPNSDINEIVNIMETTKNKYNKNNGIQGHHFIQSFSKDENINLELAHEVGKEWSEKFLEDYEFVLSTHKDKEHLHNHIVINSVNVKNGKKYISDIKERENIRRLSDEVCREYGLSIIKKKDINKNKSYAEWKYNSKNISWKDKIKIDINDCIKVSNDYKKFINLMKSKGYNLRYGENYKYNSFEHTDIGKKIRGKTLGKEYTEENIIKRIKNKEYDVDVNLRFDEKIYFIEGISYKELIRADIDLSVLQSMKYKEFITNMKDKNYVLRYGEKYKYNSFKHKDMKRAIRGKTLGDNYIEIELINRVKDNAYIINYSNKFKEVELKKELLYSRKYVNNKFKYLKQPTIKRLSEKEKEAEIKNQVKKEKINISIETLENYNITTVSEYMNFKIKNQEKLNFNINKFNKLIENHNIKLKEYNLNKNKFLRKEIVESKNKIEKLNKEIIKQKELKEKFIIVDKVLLEEKNKEKNKERGVKEIDNIIR